MLKCGRAFTIGPFLLFGIAISCGAQAQLAGHPHPGWMTYQSPHFAFFYAPGSQLSRSEEIEKFAAGEEQALYAICTYLGVPPRRKIAFYAYDNNEAAMELVGHTLAFAMPKQAAIHSSVDHTRGHEITHVVAYWGGQSGANRLFGEGIATYLDQSGRDYFQIGRAALERGELPTLAQILEQTKKGDGYQFAASFVAYLCEIHGVAKFKAVWSTPPVQCDRAFRFVYGQSTLQMEYNWHEYLKQYQEHPSSITDQAASARLKHRGR